MNIKESIKKYDKKCSKYMDAKISVFAESKDLMKEMLNDISDKKLFFDPDFGEVCNIVHEGDGDNETAMVFCDVSGIYLDTDEKSVFFGEIWVETENGDTILQNLRVDDVVSVCEIAIASYERTKEEENE